MTRLGVLLLVIVLMHATISNAYIAKIGACRMVCKMVTPGSCNCPNGQIPSWHKRKRRETNGVCREEELREEHNRYVKEVTDLIDNLLTKIYGEETPPVNENEAVTEVFP